MTGTPTGSLFWAHAAVSQTPLDCDTSGSPDRGASGMHALPDGVSGRSMSHVTAPTCVLRALLLFTFALQPRKASQSTLSPEFDASHLLFLLEADLFGVLQITRRASKNARETSMSCVRQFLLCKCISAKRIWCCPIQAARCNP